MKFKQLQIAVLFLLAGFTSRASTPYHWECGTFTIDATDTLISCPQISTNYIYFTITNTGTTDINVRQIINASNLPVGWSVNMCNPNGCWGSNVLADTFLVPAGSFVTARFDFHADTTIGIGITSVRFDDAISSAVNGATFNLHAVSLGTGMVEVRNENNSILLYPNPVINQFTIYDERFTIEKLEIFNVAGEKIFLSPLSLERGAGGELKLNITSLKTGIYFVKLHGESGERTGKFVKQ